MRNKTLIGFTGQARCGKDTAAKHLNNNYGIPLYAFAQPIKQACRAVFGWGEEQVNGALKEDIDPLFNISPREAMQTLGTQWGRELINEDIWLKRAEHEMMINKALVITDVRFNNEAELIKSRGGIVINITRKNKAQVLSHKSENGIDSDLINYTIENNGTLIELYQAIDFVINKNVMSK